MRPSPVRPLTLLAAAALWMAPPAAAQDRPRAELLVRIDDLEMNHSVNLAQLAEAGMRRPP